MSIILITGGNGYIGSFTSKIFNKKKLYLWIITQDQVIKSRV